MKPIAVLERVQTPLGEMTLSRRDADFSIRVAGVELMNSRNHVSEDELGKIACTPVRDRMAPRVLIGGLGLGYTLRAALDVLPSTARIDVCELVPAVVRWNREVFGALAKHPLADPRVHVIEDDVARVIERAGHTSPRSHVTEDDVARVIERAGRAQRDGADERAMHAERDSSTEHATRDGVTEHERAMHAECDSSTEHATRDGATEHERAMHAERDSSTEPATRYDATEHATRDATEPATRYDAILLDVDNGPDGLARHNDKLYRARGLAAARDALVADGVLAVWSSFESPTFTKWLRDAGFTVEIARIKARGSAHVVWLATSAGGRPATPGPRAPSTSRRRARS